MRTVEWNGARWNNRFKCSSTNTSQGNAEGRLFFFFFCAQTQYPVKNILQQCQLIRSRAALARLGPFITANSRLKMQHSELNHIQHGDKPLSQITGKSLTMTSLSIEMLVCSKYQYYSSHNSSTYQLQTRNTSFFQTFPSPSQHTTLIDYRYKSFKSGLPGTCGQTRSTN